MKFIVVMATFNRSGMIENAINSVLSQSYTNWNLIVVNDGSSDNTDDVLSMYDDERIHIVSYKDNRGVNFARNQALEYISNQGLSGYVTFLDDDDTFVSDCLSNIKDRIEGLPGYSWYVGKCVRTDGLAISKISSEGRYSYLYDYMFGSKVRGDLTNFISTDVALSSGFSKDFKNSEEWCYFSKVSSATDFYYFDEICKIVQCLPDGLLRSKVNRDKKIAVLVFKIKYLSEFVDAEYLQKNILSLLNELIKSNRISEIPLWESKLLFKSKVSYKYFLFSIRRLRKSFS